MNLSEREQRALKDYVKRFGPNADQPGMVEEIDGVIELSNANGTLATYKVTAGGTVRFVG